MPNNTSIQFIFADSAIQLIVNAYNGGILQEYPMTILGIEVELRITSSDFNVLSMIDHEMQRMQSINIYDNDSEAAQFASIAGLFHAIIA